MADPSLDEMYGHLQNAHALGDTELASAIAQKIKGAEDVLHPPQDFMDKVGSAIQSAATLGPATKSFLGIPDKEKVLSGSDIAAGLGKQGLKAASLLVPGSSALKALGWGGKLAAGALQGAASGALMGAGDTKSNDLGEMASNAVSGGLFGGAVGGGLTGVGQVAGAALDKARPWLSEAANHLANRAAKGYASISAKRTLTPGAAEQAYQTGVIAAGDTTTSIAGKAKKLVDEIRTPYNATVKGLADAGVTVDGVQLANRLEQAGQEAAKLDTAGPLPALYRKQAQEILRVATEHDPVNGMIPLDAMEAIKSRVGDEAKAAFKSVEGQASTNGKALKSLYGMFQRESEQAVSAQSSLAPQLAQDWIPLKDRMAKALEVQDAAVVGRARELTRHLPLMSSLVGAGYGYEKGGVKGAMAGATTPFMLMRAPATLGAGVRALSRAGAPGIASPRLSAVAQYLRDMNKEPDDAP
jgi:hypothetical protein